MRDIEKKLSEYYRTQTENAPVKNIETTKNEEIKYKRIGKRNWIKAAVAAVLAVAIGVGFINSDYQRFFTPSEITAPAVSKDDSERDENSVFADSESSVASAATDDSSVGNGSTNNTSSEFNEDGSSAPEHSTDVSTPPDNVQDPPATHTQPKTVYADGFSFGGGDEIYSLDEMRMIWGYQDIVEKNPKDIYYVLLKPSCLEYLCYVNSIHRSDETLPSKNFAGEDRLGYTPQSFKQWKEDVQWMIEKDMETFKSFGIEATVYYYGYDWDALVLNESVYTAYYHTLEDDTVGNFGYFFSAYVSGETLINYKKAAIDEFYRVNDASRKIAAEKYYNVFGREAGEDVLCSYDEYVISALYNDYYEYGLTTPKALAKILQTKWEEYAVQGLRPTFPSGGSISLLPKCDEKELAFKYYLSTFESSD